MYHRILVPLDGSEVGESALPHAADLATCMKSEIILLRVVTYALHDVLAGDPALGGTLTDDLRSIRQAAETYLEGVAIRVRSRGLDVRTVLVDDARVADAILDCAHEQAADVIVMSTHGRSGMTRWLLGSVATRVVHGSHIPILLVRPAALGN